MKLDTGRIIIGGTNSGCGKTTITCGILKALKNRNINVSAFKIGPDYIDPMFHKIITGKKSKNLDSFIMGENAVLNSLYNFGKKSDFSVIEGVMGYYDGLGGKTSLASTAYIGNITNTPAVLVFNPKGMALSSAAILKGFLEFEKNTVKGVILNNVKSVNYYKDIIESQLELEVLGCIPFSEELSFESRHLGLAADKINDIEKKINEIGKICNDFIDLDRLLKIGESAEEKEFDEIEIKNILNHKIKIAVAYDKAFCFYYDDNFEILKKAGAEIVFFSPVKDKFLPDDISGIYIGGGYPELYLKELSENYLIKNLIFDLAKKGIPIFAECGGFMYLQESISDFLNKKFEMCGVINGNCYMTDKLSNFGYFVLKSDRDNMLLNKGDEINVHEFHYSKSDNEGDCFTASKPMTSKKRKCIFAENNIFGGYPHFNFYGNLNILYNFLKACENWKYF